MKLKLPSILFSLLTISGVFSTFSYGHDVTDIQASHEYEDIYLAAKISAEEAQSNSLKPKKTALKSMPAATTVVKNPAIYGQWSPLTVWPFAFASAANLPDGRIFAWGGNTPGAFGANKAFTYGAIWNPVTGQMVTVNHHTHSAFCAVPVMLEDGRVFMPGGNLKEPTSPRGTSIFDYRTQTWTRIQDMAVGRWYNGVVALPNGQVFTALGQPGSPYPEIWTEGLGWAYLNGASLAKGILAYPTVTEPKNMLPKFHLAPSGQIFHSGHTPEMHWIDPTNNGSVTKVAIKNQWNMAYVPSVLFNEGKLLQAGGAYFNSQNNATNQAVVIDINSGIPTQTATNPMQYPRIFHNQVVLPNGEVMVVGGNTTGKKFSDVGAQFTPEIWNSATQNWRPVADIQVPRTYHSVALLMTDGRVWSGGGGLCNCIENHPDSQVFSPPYLFNSDGSLATRPEILDAPDTISYGLKANVQTTSGVTRFTMIRMSATTHTLNSDMRLLNVPFVTISDGNYELNFHTNRNVMTPGYWMLFALNAQGVPSVAKTIQVTTSNTPVIFNPGDQNTAIDTSLILNIQAQEPNGDPLAFNAIGLPQGLTINSTTGIISGIPVSAGSSRVVISVTDGVNIATTSFVWTVNINNTPIKSTIFGATSGVIFNDTPAVNQYLTGINIRSDKWINGIQGVLNNFTPVRHGGTAGVLTQVTWPANEYLVRIYGAYSGDYIAQISFVTNTGRVLGPYGTGQGMTNLTSFDYSVPANQEIIGFAGRANTHLTAIGVIYRPHQIYNQPPLSSLVANQINKVGDSVNLMVTATDPDSDTLTYTAMGLPSGLSIASATGTISGQPTTAGYYDVIVTSQDASGATSAVNFSWSINAVLSVNAIKTTQQVVNVPVNLTARVSNARNLLIKWSFGDGTPETTYANAETASHVFTNPGLYVVRATVTDDSGVTVTTTSTQAVYLPQTVNRPALSSNMAYSTNNGNNLLWVVNQDNDSVSVFNAQNNTKLAEVAVGQSPRAIAIAPDGRAWVTNKAAGTVSIIDPVSLQVQQTISLPFASQPFGLAFAPNGKAVFVVLEAVGNVIKLDSSSGQLISSVNVGTNPRHIAITRDSSQLLVSRFITKPLPGENTATVQTTVNNINSGGEVILVDANAMTVLQTIVLQHSDKQDSEASGAGIPNYLAMAAISPDGLSAWIPSKQDNIKRGTLRNGNNLNFSNTVRSIASRINLTTMTEDYPSRIDFDNSGLASAATFDHYGNFMFVALQTSREVSIVDAYGDRELGRIQVGRAPDGVVVSADGQTLYINNFMDRTISVVDLSQLINGISLAPSITATLSTVATEKLPANVLTGKQLFFDAKDTRLASDGYLSCASCHNDGGHDGRVWDFTGFGEGLRNTIDMRGRAGMSEGFLHWSGNFDEVQDFEGQIRSFAGGTGLMTDVNFATTQNPLGPPKAGLSADLDALAAYVTSLATFASSPLRNADGSLTTTAVAGKQLFYSSGCIQCHGADPFTDSPSHLVHDIGTIYSGSGKRLNGTLVGFDTPTLRDIWNTAPYLHDGSALSVDSAILAHKNITLNTAQVAQVAAYVQQLGNVEPGFTNNPPKIALTRPFNGTAFKSGTAINLNANAADNDGIVTKVEFYVDNALLGTVSSIPYHIVWTGGSVGAHSLTLKAYDNYGAISTTTASTINIHN